ncbi:hypothetical protein DPMN_143131 [Dreissena polymorpha]|uniref:Uncharacterized protein n=1 Tax=Dreissena polymorpha TaxID=45954 RepID=A0A9D4JJE0_DREPO|nr:hypothetical protein DPMN_143131 [Dreissena polymorpha]
MAGISKNTCTILTTSRPWELADECIKNSQIDSLLEIEGISDPFSFCKNILRCIIDQTMHIGNTMFVFWKFIEQRGLESLSSSPMLFALVICTWVDTFEAKERLK